MKNVLIIAASPRKDGNSNELAKSFRQGVADGGNNAETIYLYDKSISFCRGCLACQKTGHCVIRDDADEICQKMNKADVLVFATPIYYYSVSGQLKTLLDRANPLFGGDYAFRDVYLLATAADEDQSASDGARTAVQGWIDCFGRATFREVIFGGGVNDVGDIKGHSAIQKAYETGKNV